MQQKKAVRKSVKLASILCGLVFLGIQFVPTSVKTETSPIAGPYMTEVVNSQVGAILDRSCRDCHSSHTDWPWYSRVAPVSWVISKHVSEGREVLDFTEWTNQPPSSDERTLMCDAVSDARMPLPEYTVMHPKAKLSRRDVELICQWAAAPRALQASKSE